MLDVTLLPKAEVYLSAEEVPLLWLYPYGRGKVAYWNTTFLATKMSRGLLLHSIGLAVPQFVSAQAAIKVMFIDDFPAPIPAQLEESLRVQFGQSLDRFYKERWWEDMKSLADIHQLKYTAAFIGTYQNELELKAEELIRQNRNQMMYYGRELLRLGHEIGFHGYNHQALVTEEEPQDAELGYRPWASQVEMEEGIQRAYQLFEHYFPNISIETYVPPSNILNQTGFQAIKNQLPSMKVLASLYTGNSQSGAYVQEFRLDSNYPNLYHLPRISSGYIIDQEMHHSIVDALANFGVFSHFIHPDDVLDEFRSRGQDWTAMKEGLEHYFAVMNQVYPHLRAYTAAEAREKLLIYQQAELHVFYQPDQITITGKELSNPTDVIVRLEAGQQLATGSFDGYEVTQLPHPEPLYAVTLTKPYVVLPVLVAGE